MDASERYYLVRELELIKSRESKGENRRGLFWIAFFPLVVSAELIVLTIQAAHNYSAWIAFLLAFVAVAILAASVYGMVRHILDRRLMIIIQAILSEKDPEGTTSAKE